MLGNGVCESACSRSECNWDYRDCECERVLDTCEGVSGDGSDSDTSYDNNVNQCWLIQPKARASRIHLHWTRFDVTTAALDPTHPLEIASPSISLYLPLSPLGAHRCAPLPFRTFPNPP